ncbi:MAG: hypothetical protein V4514_20745 [Pseudomonadota bacterium]|uniref:hypothetical protein n=1 Tax=unclassified Phenylobacterium TaxID=2640670 RepID=UPI0006FB89E5|nr:MULTISPECIES: hypothetical protein [unclassified Phenylobacterium]KRB48652.1 hypothetical protein ASE02_18695 [Phenylobacterium sp. Root700]MBT9473556.1 hypothetical protein [Phenylobacterium sp.]
MFSSTPERVWAIAMFAVSAFALWRGGRTERVVAIANIVAWIATIVVQNRSNWVDPQWGMFAVDVAFLLVLLWFVIRGSRLWILPAAAFQLLAVVTHGAILADGGVRAWAYLTALILWSYLVLITLAVGAYTYWRREAAPGHAQVQAW